MSKKKKRIFGAIVFGIVTVLGLVILFLVKDNSSNHISVATAAKMLSLLEADKNRISQSKDCFNDKKNIWYEKYINYMVEKNYIDTSNFSYNKSISIK